MEMPTMAYPHRIDESCPRNDPSNKKSFRIELASLHFSNGSTFESIVSQMSDMAGTEIRKFARKDTIAGENDAKLSLPNGQRIKDILCLR